MKWHINLQMQLGDLELDVHMKGDEKPVALIGPNGSGKTTLLRTIAGAYAPESGHIQIGHRLLYDAANKLSLPPEQRRIGYLPQGYALFPHLNVLDNVAFGLMAQNPQSNKAQRQQRAFAQLEKLHGAHLAQRWPKTLSGGEQQRVSLARALMVNPEFLLLDEPLAALDATARRNLRTYLAAQLAQRKGPALMVTQDMKDVLALDAEVYVLQEGKIIQHGSASQLQKSPANDFVAEFFNSQESPPGSPIPHQ